MLQRFQFAAYIIIGIFVLFALRLWHLQIIKKNEFISMAKQNRIRVLKMPAPRGIIYDANNFPVVRNVPSFNVFVSSAEWKKNPDAKIQYICELLELDEAEIKEKITKCVKNGYEQIEIKEDISWLELAELEARKIDYPWIKIDVGLRREYLYNASAGHVVGHLGYLTDEQVNDLAYEDVPRTVMVGQKGMEKEYDSVLRGISGKEIIEVDALGREINTLKVLKPIKGRDIKLTIDMSLQLVAENALDKNTGSIVVLNPRNGEILVLASMPTFDPNLFSKGISTKDWNILIKDPQKPFLNRAVQSYYPPGSAFKVVTALAALQEGIVDANTNFDCKGMVLMGNARFRCWKHSGHGTVNLHRSLVESCDVYYYEVAKRLGIDRIAMYARSFGLGEPVGLEQSFLEKGGIVPSRAWKLKKMRKPWFPGETLSASIGQGYVSATPIQMAQVIGAIANDGKIYPPHLIKGTDVNPFEVIVNKKYISLIKKALRDVVATDRGTGKNAASPFISIAGKTGTAQVISMKKYSKHIKKYRDHAWFVAFAPYENPEIAMSILVEHGGHGGSTCGPIAKKVAEAYYFGQRAIKKKVNLSKNKS